MSTTHSVISTSRLELVPTRVELTERVVGFYKRNDLHLAPWDPPRPEGFHTETFQRGRMVQAEVEAAAGTAMRWWLCLRSLRLLEQLGFEREGFARDYLFIDGAWRDHAMLALRNAEFSGMPI